MIEDVDFLCILFLLTRCAHNTRAGRLAAKCCPIYSADVTVDRIAFLSIQPVL